mgnify:CR=1 FL=1
MERGHTGEVDVMHGADDAARGVEDDVQIDHAERRAFVDDAEQDEDVEGVVNLAASAYSRHDMLSNE